MSVRTIKERFSEIYTWTIGLFSKIALKNIVLKNYLLSSKKKSAPNSKKKITFVFSIPIQWLYTQEVYNNSPWFNFYSVDKSNMKTKYTIVITWPDRTYQCMYRNNGELIFLSLWTISHQIAMIIINMTMRQCIFWLVGKIYQFIVWYRTIIHYCRHVARQNLLMHVS